METFFGHPIHELMAITFIAMPYALIIEIPHNSRPAANSAVGSMIGNPLTLFLEFKTKLSSVITPPPLSKARYLNASMLILIIDLYVYTLCCVSKSSAMLEWVADYDTAESTPPIRHCAY